MVRFSLIERWTCKQGARVLGIAESKWTQAAEPAIRKVAALLLADPLKTNLALVEAMDEIRQEQFTQMELPGMIEERTGRANRHKSITAGE